jgi:hypothetical protein
VSYRRGGIVEFEGKVEHTTAKARLVKPTMGPEEVWVPKSQTFAMSPPDEYGNVLFTVTEWWASKNGLSYENRE